MLTVTDPRRRSHRRDFLRIGGLSLGGLSLAKLLAAEGRGSTAPGKLTRGKSCVFLMMHGGPSQIETFDPKMDAPVEIRSVTKEVKTNLSGVSYGGTFSKLANLADQTAVVRSFTTGSGNHDIKPIVSKHSMGANIGSIYARVAGANNAETGMPTNAAIFPRSVDPDRQKRNTNFGKFASTGPLQSAYAPFIPGSDGPLQKSLKLEMPQDRMDDRQSLLARVDRLKRNVDQGELEGLDQYQQQAVRTVLGGVGEAFDLSKEDPKTIARYDTAPLVSPDKISKAWNNYNNYVDHVKSLGKLMLLARRLCEAGCGFVTVTTNFVWDMHADRNNATMDEGMTYCGLAFDHAVSTFIQDCAERGLSDDILLVATGEMGRTPKINAKGGRDHWGGSAPLLLSGGGLQMGQVIGQSTKDAGQPATKPMTIDHLIATIMHTMLDVGELRLDTSIPADVSRLITGGSPIPGLLS